MILAWSPARRCGRATPSLRNAQATTETPSTGRDSTYRNRNGVSMKPATSVEYEKTALRDGSPFTWSQGESLPELIRPERAEQIRLDYERRRERLKRRRPVNPLADATLDTIDDVYGINEAAGGCVVCHK